MSELPHDSQVISTLHIRTARAAYLALKVNIRQVRCAERNSSGEFTASALIMSKQLRRTKFETGGARTQND